MFLFNKHKTSIQENAVGNEVISVNWKTFLNTNPAFCAESTVVFDEDENLYFGSHSGNFYSLDKKGKIRWVFSTQKKIYSSPLLVDSKIFFAGGDGFFYCLSLEGELIWSYNLDDLKRSRAILLSRYIMHLPFTIDIRRRRNITIKSWSSPNYNNGHLYITGYGTGLYCFNLTGKLIWKYDLKFPRYQLSGVAIDDSNRIYCASRKGFAYCFDPKGTLIYKKKIRLFWEPWGNPIYDTNNNQAIFFFSKNESQGLITALGNDGIIKWQSKTSAIRGSAALSKDGVCLYYCDLNGFITKINAKTGEIVVQKKITNATRGLWTTPTIDSQGNILISTKDDNFLGRIVKLNKDLNPIWEFKTNKALSVPVINHKGDVFFGAWDGYYYSLKTK